MTERQKPNYRNDMKVSVVEQIGSDHMIAKAARVSTARDGGLAVQEQDGGLIGYLMRNKHGSPFEHGSITFRLETPIFVAREFMRHRIGWSYNEVSGRYTQLKPDFYVPGDDRPLVQEGKVGHYTFADGTDAQAVLMRLDMHEVSSLAWTRYEDMLNHGTAKEVARMVLPLNVYTAFYATCNPRSLMHFLSLRTAPDAMHEIRNAADQMEDSLALYWPQTWEAWKANGRVAP